ncbi:MAG: alpha-2-macroglobulin, partial [Flavobacteriaceae bacterium]|nr:alpha-2-macroglobulin [Bacteroidia bacterium]NNL61139.1 alpha-2-macroglobulin [Flavobacteriaceae bacterium]
QDQDFSSDWKKVEAFEKEGLPKSALKVVEEIEANAKKYDVPAQKIKVLLFKSKYALTLEEDAQLKIIDDFRSEIEKNEFPTKNMLESVLANLFWQYFQQNRWQFYNRTKTESKVDPNDFRTWDLQTLFDEIHLHFQASLENGLLAQRTELGLFDDILHTQEDSKIFRPTLFDFLNHNALAFYKTPENQITKPAYKFEISDEKLLSDAMVFSTITIESKDSSSLQLNALKIFQDLTQFHIRDGSPKALADINIERLLFVKQNATFTNKDKLLLEALKVERELHGNNDISALYDFEIANILHQQGQTYNYKTNVEPRWKLKEAIDICNRVISFFPESIGAQKCKVLKNTIETKTLSIRNEDNVPINQVAKVLVNYKNFDQLHFKVFPLTQNQLERFQKIYRKEEQIKFINNLDATKEWSSILKNEHDYQAHSTEIVIPALSNGHYLIFATLKKNDQNTFAFGAIQVTNFALVERKENGQQTYQVINRNDGRPIPGASVNFKNKRQRHGNDKNLNKTLTTDEKGQVVLKGSSNYSNIEVTISKNGEKAVFGNYYFNNRYRDSEVQTRYHAFLFTDRSIYRPGQTVYFKGIGISQTGSDSSLLVDQEVTVTLKDVNYQEIKTAKFKTNDYGSIHGEFILPNGGLTGNFTLEVRAKDIGLYSSTSFSCEEYKRPKFETKFEPVTETYKINDAIVVKGLATAYAGSNITDAKVVYRVHRNVQYPRWFYWYRPWFSSEPQEIAHGETVTNDKGEYEILFKAMPDQSVSKDELPIFHYEITADVTDINGETRSAKTKVNVGYHALTANVGVPEKLDKSEKDHKLTITTKNLNGEFVPAKGQIKIYKLIAPDHVLRPRPWAAPDFPSLSESEFKKLFPYEAYKDEHNSSTLQKGKLVYEKAFDTDKSKEVALGNMKRWDSGQYVIELESEDKFGQEVKDVARTTLFSDDDKTLADSELFGITTDKSEYNSGDKVLVTLASAAAELFVTIDIEKDAKIINSYVVQLNNNKKTITISVTKDDIGGFAIHTSISAFNSYQNGTTPIFVPYPKTDLEIETMTFRDKLQPGTDETWRFKITGPEGEKVSAELLASMYDASLDKFRPHSWNFNPFNRPHYYARLGRNGQRAFQKSGFRVYVPYSNPGNFSQQQYDQLNWFGFHFGIHRPMLLRKMRNADYGEISAQPVAQAQAIEVMADSEADLDEVIIEEGTLAYSTKGP